MQSFSTELASSSAAIIVEPSNERTALVVFGGVFEGPGMPPAEFYRVTAGLPATRIFVKDKVRAFYHHGVPGIATTFDELASHVASLTARCERTVLLGTSAGANAALIVGALTDADKVIAFSPVTFLSRSWRILHHERRWRDHVQSINRPPGPQAKYLNLRHALKEQPVKAEIYYGAHHRLDRIYAAALGSVPGVTLRPIDSAEHNIAGALRDGGDLRGIVQAALSDL